MDETIPHNLDSYPSQISMTRVRRSPSTELTLESTKKTDPAELAELTGLGKC